MNATPEKVLLSKDQKGSVGNHVDRVVRSQKLGRQASRHTLTQIIDDQVDFGHDVQVRDALSIAADDFRNGLTFCEKNEESNRDGTEDDACHNSKER